MDKVFDCYIERADDRAVVVARGEIDLQTAPEMQSCIEEAIKSYPVVVVDMSAVDFMDSTALSVLIQARSQLDAGTTLSLAAPSTAVQRILDVTGASDYFDIYTTREAAGTSSGPSPGGAREGG